MNLTISRQEYQDLLDLLHIADVVMTGHRKEEDPRTMQHRALIQKMYALANGEGLERLVAYDASMRKYVLSMEFENNSLAHDVLGEFGDHLFWAQLISDLSIRDAAQTVGGIEQLNALSESDRQAVEGPIRLRYMEEFASHGVANLAVIEQFNSSGGVPIRTSD